MALEQFCACLSASSLTVTMSHMKLLTMGTPHSLLRLTFAQGAREKRVNAFALLVSCCACSVLGVGRFVIHLPQIEGFSRGTQRTS